MLFFVIFFAIPLIEIALFVTVGQEIGLVPTLLLCFLTAALGGALIRHQGLETLMSIQKTMNSGTLPVRDLFDGLCLAIAGALLLTPGFFTDAIGFTLLVPPARSLLFAALQTHMARSMENQTTTRYTTRKDTVIEGDFQRVDTPDDGKS